MTRSLDATTRSRLSSVPDPEATRSRLARAERRVLAAALALYRSMVASGADLDRVTLAYVYGPRVDDAVLGLMDACHDAEHHQRTA
jgi:hypothetical protein